MTATSKFSRAFDQVFRSEGIDVIHTPIRAPQANAHAERFVRTIRAESLDWLPIIGRRHLETLLRIHTAHYNRERPHRGLALLPPDPTNADQPPSGGEIKRRDRLGGLIHEYHRAAASTDILNPSGTTTDGDPNRALDLQAPDPISVPVAESESITSLASVVRRHDLLGGLIHEYEFAAAA